MKEAREKTISASNTTLTCVCVSNDIARKLIVIIVCALTQQQTTDRYKKYGNLYNTRWFSQLQNFNLRRLDEGIAGAAGDAALVSVPAGHLDVALVTPARSPAVLDKPVVAAAGLIGSVTHNQNSVIQVLGITVGLIVHTGAVELEGLVAGIDGNRHGSLSGNRLSQMLLTALGDVNKSDVLTSDVGLLESAGVINSLIWVGLLGVDATVVLDVLESLVHQATVTSVVALWSAAIHQVLLAEAHKLASFSFHLSF